jgi:serine/threonine protein kinase
VPGIRAHGSECEHYGRGAAPVQSRMRGMKIRHPPEMTEKILKQSLQALACLHENGIAHGDFQPGNMLFALDNIDSKPEELLRQEVLEEEVLEEEEDGEIMPI